MTSSRAAARGIAFFVAAVDGATIVIVARQASATRSAASGSASALP